MSGFAEYWSSPISGRPQVRASLAALGVCIGGFVAGLIGILILRVVLTPAITDTDVFRVVSGNLIQVGFAAFAIIYLLRQQNRGRFVKIRRPTLEDLAWIIVIPPIVFITGEVVVTPGLTTLGFPEPMPGGEGESLALVTRPALWPVALVGLYIFAAPAEELIYRGIIHGWLREAFDLAGVVLLGGALFGLMHVIVGLVTPAVGLAGSLHWGIAAVVPGLLWGYVYERTENLLVPSVMHAISWTIPFSAFIPFI